MAKIIVLKEPLIVSVARDVFTLFSFTTLIGIGWWIGSDAMQWFGGIIAIYVLLSGVRKLGLQHTYTIEEARKVLDDLEATQ